MSDADATAVASGPPRPRFIVDASNEKAWDVVVALTTELAATRARLDALERVLTELGSMPAGAVESWQPSDEAGVARAHELQAYMQRVLGTLGRD
jgi:hypothetical protein